MASTDLAAVARAEDERLWDRLYRRATVLSRTKLVPKDCQGNPDATMAAFLTLEAHGIAPNAGSLNLLHFIEGRPEPSAQLYAALLGRHGYDIEWTELSSVRAAARLRRPDGTETIELEWTIAQAEAAGLREQWVERRTADGTWPDSGKPKYRVERFVLDRPGVDEPDWVAQERRLGNVKRNENWWRYPDDMLASKVIRRLVKRFAAQVSLGEDDDVTPISSPAPSVPLPTNEAGEDDIVDAELVQADGLVDDDWVYRFTSRIKEVTVQRGLGNANRLIDAVIRTATNGRVQDPEDVTLDEAGAVAAWTAQLIDGTAQLAGDHLEVVS